MHVYDMSAYGSMIRDSIRTCAYLRALRQCVKPDSVVLDIGTGVGIWALLACQSGARKVYAIDPNDVIQVAREIALANGYAERIEFIQDMSTRITLLEPADVVVSDMHGALPMFEQNLASIIDARRRLLVPHGQIIPQKETVWTAVVEAPECYSRMANPWNEKPYGLNMRPALHITTNMWRPPKEKITPEQLLVAPQCWATLDYATLESAHVSGHAAWTANRTGTGHGFIAWFDTVLIDGESFSNAPGAPELIFGQAFFPWPEPVSISRGDTISLGIRADLVGGDYIWGWETTVLDQGRTQKIKAEFKQSTFSGTTLSPTRLRKRASGHVPALHEDGQIDWFVLSQMDGAASLDEIASRLLERFPTRFAGRQDALTRIGQLSETYSR